MAVRIRIPLPVTEEALPYLIAAGGHLVLILFLFGWIGARSSPGALGPTLTVRLTGPSRSGRPGAAGGARAPRATPPQPAAPIKEKPPTRTTAGPKPTNIARRPAGATAQPAQLPKAERQVPEPAPAAPPAAPNGASGSESLGAGPAGPIAGGVAGGLEEVGGSDWYVGLVVNRLQDAWRDRPLLPAGSPPLRASVSFVIHRGGQVSDVRLETPSGYTPLDSSVVRAVLSLAQLPPLPTVYGKDRLRAQFIFELQPPDEP